MKNKIVLSSITTLAVWSLVGCGGSGSSNATVATGKSFYVDSAVSGINYKCGTQEGITDADGGFTFDVGSSCTFYLGDIQLRDVAADALKDGESIVEDDVKIAQLLQTLDVDGDPSNGITVSPEVVAAMTTALSENGGNGALPDTEAELNALSAELETEVPEYEGHAVTEAEAEEHLTTTIATVGAQKIKTLLSGKTIYVPNVDGTVFEVKFDDKLTTQTFTENGQVKTDPLRLDGEKLYVDDNDYIVFVEDKGDYLLFDEFQDGIKQAPIRIYFDKAKAEAYANEAFSVLIIGKTFYVTDENNVVQTLTFGDNGTGTYMNEIFTYSISGNVLTVDTPDGVKTFTNIEQFGDHLEFRDKNGQETGRFFFTEAAATDSLNSTPSTPAPTTQTALSITPVMIEGKTFYDKDSDIDGHSFAKMTMTGTTATRHEIWYYDANNTVRSDDTFTFNYTLVDGKIKVDLAQFNNGYKWFTLTNETSDALTLLEENDTDADGNIDELGKTQTWFTSKPMDFPSSL